MKVIEEFISASVNPRSHCLASCNSQKLVVYASSLQLAVQTIPENDGEIGVIRSLSEKRHSRPITTVKRLKASEEDYFVSGGVDSRVNLWRLASNQLEYIVNLEGCSGSIGAVCGCASQNRKILVSAWVGDETHGVTAWWIGGEDQKSCQIELDQKAFALCLDIMRLDSGSALLAVGTSKRFVELYGESENTFSRLISVAGHTDWIHSIAFNDNPSNILLASAGQDTYVRLWAIENDDGDQKCEEEAEDELTSSRNKFSVKISNGKENPMRISSYAVMQGHDDWVHSTTWNSTGDMLLTASSDKTCIIWREIDELWRDDVRLGIVGGQSAGFFAAVFSSTSNQIVGSSYFGGLHAWRAEDDTRTFWNAVPMCGGHVGEVRDVDWQTAADATSKFLVSVGQDQTTRVFAKSNKNGFVEIGRPQVHGHDMQCIAMVTPSVFVSGAEEKIFRAFRAPRTFVATLETIGGIAPISAFGDTPIADFGACVPALGLSNKAMAEGETVDGEHWEEDAFQAAPTVLKNAPTEDTLQQNTLWPEEHKLYGHGYEVYAVAVNPTSTILATACKSSHPQHSSLILWSTKDWSKKAEIPGHQLTVTQISWNPKGTALLTVSRDRTAKLYKERNGNVDGVEYECVWTSGKQHSRIIWSCHWFSDSAHFATASRDQKVIVWSLDEAATNAQPVATVKLDQPVTAVAVSHGDLSQSLIAAGLQTGEIVILRAVDQTLEIVESIGKNPIPIDAAVLRLRFSKPDESGGQKLAVASSDAKLRVFDVRS